MTWTLDIFTFNLKKEMKNTGDWPLVSIISVHFNEVAATAEMLRSVTNCGYPNLEIILVDNASKLDVRTVLGDQFPMVKFIRSEINKGFAGGNNLGIRQSEGEFLFLLNNDAILPTGTLERMICDFDEIENLGVLSPKILFFPTNEPGQHEVIQFAGSSLVHPLSGRNRNIGYGEPDQGQRDVLRWTAYAHGAAMMLPRKVIERAGLMEEAYFLFYEELDWCARIRKMGFEIMIDGRVKVYHCESLSVGQRSPLKTYYMNRSRILFLRKHSKGYQFLVFAVFFIVLTIPKFTVNFIAKSDWKNFRAFFRAIGWHLKNPLRKQKEEELASLQKNVLTKPMAVES